MIEKPKITDEQQKQLRYDFITMVEEYDDQDELEAFRAEWDGTVNFKIIDDHTVIANVAGEEKLPAELKEKTRRMIARFNDGNYG